ncbi:hypothetical protein [Xanthomonas campestris]|uniref:Uncharacterized protein n=1 Tax=Xanthomonas campestris pv. papavericola TaxID=487881 RepID=A0AAJ2X513_XANCA|nr:hypothetical protein [Xanthomonas campestris]MEC3888898.1 hypothetical protein [Xanthomonas campestris pv. papavericola]
MDERISRLKTSIEAKTFAENARRLGQPALETHALKRAGELRAQEEGYRTPAQQAIAAALYAYEERQSESKGQSFRANRTRQMLNKHGSLAAAERMVLNKKPSTGYEVLEDAGLQELTFEAIIDRFPEEFSNAAITAARARLHHPSDSPELREEESTATSKRKPDADALSFLEGFRDQTSWFYATWMPNYRKAVETIRHSLSEGRPEDVFDKIWKTQDNSISHAGPGLLAFGEVDNLRPRLIQMLRDIDADGSPSHFDRIAVQFDEWKMQGLVSKIPWILIARAFAGIHPQLYHTTVGDAYQNSLMPWFASHTGFAIPRSRSWAVRAHALTEHLEDLGVFGSDYLARNIFPWFVHCQIDSSKFSKDISSDYAPPLGETSYLLAGAERVVSLRHNLVQAALLTSLRHEFSDCIVRAEHPTGTGGRADAVVRFPDGKLWLYEVKISDTAIAVVREAMGQLLEYAFRPKGLNASKLIVVGEPELDEGTERYLDRLRSDFNLSIEYQQILVP